MTRGSKRSRFRPSRTVLFVVALATLTLSCSPRLKEGAKPVHPVRGQLFVGDKPASGAFVLFIPVNEPAGNPEPRPRATVEPDGTFKVSTFGADDGAPAGEYLVTATWPGGVLPDGREEPEDKLLGRYANPSRPAARVTIREGSNELELIRLK